MGIDNRNKIKLIFEDGDPLWFSCKASGKHCTAPKSGNPACAEMLRFAYNKILALRCNIKMLPDISKLQMYRRGKAESSDIFRRRRLASRQPVKYYNHFPPFVRTCQEILDALDDAGV